MNGAHERNVDPEKSSHVPLNPLDNTQDAKTQRDLD